MYYLNFIFSISTQKIICKINEKVRCSHEDTEDMIWLYSCVYRCALVVHSLLSLLII